LRHPGLWDQLLPATYLAVFLLVLAGSALALWREGRRPAAVTASTPISGSAYSADQFVH
jgi:alpha-1,2-mannosyltransferase